MQIRISGPGAIFTSAKCRCREEALAPLQIFAHACAQLSSESRVVFAASKRVTRNEPLFLVSKKRLESPLTLLDPSLCDLWKTTTTCHTLPPLSRSLVFLLASLDSCSSLLHFCPSRWEGIEFYGRVEWYGRGIRQEARANRSVIVFTYPLWGEYRLKKCLLFRDKYILNVLSV